MTYYSNERESDEISLATIALARYRLSKYMELTPMIEAHEFGKRTFFKMEIWNKTKSFKVRGALNALLGARDGPSRADEFVCASSGNHALALAYASHLLGVNTRILVPKYTSARKVAGIERYHAEPIFIGDTYDEAEAEARRIEKSEGLKFISPYNNVDIISGTGTIGLEILEQMPKVERVIVPVSGGGLISGIALALKTHNPFIEIIGVCAASAPSMYNIFYNSYLTPKWDTIADALTGAVENSSMTIDLVRKYVDKIVLVTEEQIESAMRHMVFTYGYVVEGGGAVALAAVRSVLEMDGRPTVLVISGANVDNQTLVSVLNKEDE